MRLHCRVADAGLAVIAVAAALGLCELFARLAVHPADLLSVEMVADPVLGAVPSASTRAGGFDAWGFRNPGVPAAADVVALGDSHTYGNGARMTDSWPQVLGELSGRTVYNMGLGGYGPIQYLELLRTRGVALRPRVVVCGLYMGDDFENAFLIAYGLDRWSALRGLAPAVVQYDIWRAPSTETWHKRLRVWLSRHSVAYQVVVHGAAQRLKGEVQIRNARSLYKEVAVLDVPKENILEAFVPGQILRRLDQESAIVREGMRITFEVLREMQTTAEQHGARFVVAVIPTKEMVFAEYFDRSVGLELRATIMKLIENERIARDRTFAFLHKESVLAIDTLPALRRNVRSELYARHPTDMHPNRNGYRVIAEAIRDRLLEVPK